MESAREPIVPDLLNARLQPPGNLQALRNALKFAFAGGESAGALRRALASCEASPSDWRARDFAGDLFVDALIERGFRIPRARFADASGRRRAWPSSGRSCCSPRVRRPASHSARTSCASCASARRSGRAS